MNQIHLKNGQQIGDGLPCYVIAEIGINHNGSLKVAKELIAEAKNAGCDAVKFQKRTPELCTPKDQWHIERDTPWGRMTYIDYRHRVEFGKEEFNEIDQYARQLKIAWFASCWDAPSVDFIEQFDPVLYKASSASLVDIELLEKMKSTGKPLIISTGMSTQEEIDSIVDLIGTENLLIAHSTSAYPCRLEELNLRMIQTLQSQFPNTVIGYSGHETGLATSVTAAVLGAAFIERHFTLDRAMWGSDQAASVEPVGMQRLIRDIRSTEIALGDGVKKVYDSELKAKEKLRLIKNIETKAG